ncbi:hypothetical protein ACE6H2_026385 [Prunus campanulata]
MIIFVLMELSWVVSTAGASASASGIGSVAVAAGELSPPKQLKRALIAASKLLSLNPSNTTVLIIASSPDIAAAGEDFSIL